MSVDVSNDKLRLLFPAIEVLNVKVVFIYSADFEFDTRNGEPDILQLAYKVEKV